LYRIAQTAQEPPQEERIVQPDRVVIYIALGLVTGLIATMTGPSLALLSLMPVVGVVEVINLVAAPGDIPVEQIISLSEAQGE